MGKPKSPRDVVVIGGSAGSIEGLLRLSAALPPEFPGSVFVAVHGGPQSRIAELMGRRSALQAREAVDGLAVSPGCLYVAPADKHLVLEGRVMRVTHGPKDNGFRPSVDALFRSAARAYGPRVAGVILSGALDCGAAGLRVIKSMGGAAIVQDPEEALYPSMPLHAIGAVTPDAVLRLDQIAPYLAEQTARPGAPRAAPLSREATAVMEGEAPGLTCPECHGTLAEVGPGAPGVFRCHVGHVFSLAGLSQEQARDLEGALWTAVRALNESEAVSLRLGKGQDSGVAKRQLERASALRRCSGLITKFLLSAGAAAVDTPDLVSEGHIQPRRLKTAEEARPGAQVPQDSGRARAGRRSRRSRAVRRPASL